MPVSKNKEYPALKFPCTLISAWWAGCEDLTAGTLEVDKNPQRNAWSRLEIVGDLCWLHRRFPPSILKTCNLQNKFSQQQILLQGLNRTLASNGVKAVYQGSETGQS